MNAYQFFLKYAGCSYDASNETAKQGRIRGARQLAKAEREARDEGFTHNWSIDQHVDSSEFSDSEPYQLWQCAMYNALGEIVNSLHGIDFGRDGSPFNSTYKRVVEAELALDGLTNEPQ